MNAIAKPLSIYIIYLALFVTLGAAHAADERPGPVNLRAAALAQEKGNLGQAVEFYAKALEDNRLTKDRKGIIHTDRGVVYARLGDYKQAIEDFNAAIRLFPEYAAAYNNRGSVLLSLGLLEKANKKRLSFIAEARKDFERAIVLAPDYVAALNNRASVYVIMNELGLAIEDYTTAIKSAPEEAVLLAGRARVKITQRRPFAAMRDLNRAILNDNRFVMGYRLRGQVHADLEDYTSAAEDLSRAIALDPKNANAYLARGRIYLNAGDVQAAAKDFSQVVALRPTSATAYRERGHTNVLLNNFEQAQQDLAQSLSLNSRQGSTFAYLALMHKKQGQPELGVQEIGKALRFNPKDPIVLWAKGEIEEALSNVNAAAQSYRQALAGDQNLKNAQFGLARLGQPPLRKVELLEKLTFGSWSVTRELDRYFAQHQDFPKLRVPLEMVSKESVPEIISWEEKSDEFKGIGVLTFAAGKTATRTEQVEVEYAALINMTRQTLIDLVPHRIGKETAKWTWQAGRVQIAGVDGLDAQHILRRSRDSRSISSARRRRSRDADGNAAWAPWADSSSARKKRTASRKRKVKKKPKTLFDMLLGN